MHPFIFEFGVFLLFSDTKAKFNHNRYFFKQFKVLYGYIDDAVKLETLMSFTITFQLE
jgi:hypothetical protein